MKRPKLRVLTQQKPLLAVLGLLLACPWGAVAQDGTEDGIVTNPLSSFDVTVDGLFSGGVDAASVQGEWSDITPIGFLSPPFGTFEDLLRTPPGTPNALTYAAVAPGIQGGEVVDGLYLMYAYGPRTNTFFDAGEFIADVIFPMTVDACDDGCFKETLVRVLFQGAVFPESSEDPAAGTEIAGLIPIDDDGDGFADGFAPSLFTVSVFADLNEDSQFTDTDPQIFGSGIEGAIGFGPSPLSGGENSLIHLLVEVEVPLLIDAAAVTDPESPFFGGVGFDVFGTPTGYSPDPVFWGASAANDAIDPPASAGIVSIDPNTGATTFDASSVQPNIPEPTSGLLTLVGALAAAGWRLGAGRKA